MQGASSKHKQNKNTNPVISRQDLPPHSALLIRGKTNKKLSTNLTYTKLTQTIGPNLGGQKQKGRKNSTLKPGKGDLKHNKLKKIIMKMQRNTTQIKEQTRNTEVQINEEEIGKVPENFSKKK